MCAGCPQEFRWRRRVAWPGCLQSARIPRGSSRLASRRREVFVPRNQRCGLLPTRPLQFLSPSAVGRLAEEEEEAEVEEAAARVAVAPVAAREVEAEVEGPAAELAEAGERVAARAGSTPAALSITR